MAVLIDSSVLIEIERRGLALQDLLHKLDPDEPVAVAALTISELLVGAYLGSVDQRRQRENRVEELEKVIEVVDFDVLAARTHARIWAILRRAGNLISPHDLIIAATALTNGYGVLTGNAREFRRVPDLDVREPSW
jgi:tRNA(fMet)-specific endonuclease VapC